MIEGLTGGRSDAQTVHATGDINADGDVIAGGISLKGHKHGGVQAGGAVSGTPVAA